MSWNKEQVERLKHLWCNGMSASQIASELGNGITRNAVIGKIHRLGLARHERSKSTEPTHGLRPPFPDFQSHRAADAEPQNNLMRQRSSETEYKSTYRATTLKQIHNNGLKNNRITITELRDAMCRWPIGDPASPEFRFCGERTMGVGPYCEHHVVLAYQPSHDKRREREKERRIFKVVS